MKYAPSMPSTPSPIPVPNPTQKPEGSTDEKSKDESITDRINKLLETSSVTVAGSMRPVYIPLFQNQINKRSRFVVNDTEIGTDSGNLMRLNITIEFTTYNSPKQGVTGLKTKEVT